MSLIEPAARPACRAGRPRSFDRDSALALAMEAFWREGYDNTSIAALTDRIGIKPASLYAAFGDKDQLFTLASDRYVAVFRDALAECLDAPTAEHAVRRVFERLAVAHTRRDTPPGCLIFEEPRLKNERARTRQAIKRRIARGQRDGEFTEATDVNALTDFVCVVIAGMSAKARDGATRTALLATARTAMQAWPARRTR